MTYIIITVFYLCSIDIILYIWGARAAKPFAREMKGEGFISFIGKGVAKPSAIQLAKFGWARAAKPFPKI